jgi:hypothetical protein
VVAELLDTDEAKTLLAYESDSISQLPHVSNQKVHFNGKGEDGHETFLFQRKEEIRDYQTAEGAKRAFVFCKTAQKPYDKYVVACLIIAKSIFGKDVNISSDGDLEDWQEGKKLAETAMNSTVTLSQNKDGQFQVESKKNETSPEEFIADITR